MAYDIIYADFPWPYTFFGTAKITYEMMSEEEIANFDFSPFMSKDCILFSWATGPKMDIAFRCGEIWKEKYGLHYQGIPYIWIKTKKDGVTPIGASGPRPRLVKPLSEFIMAFSTTPKKRTFPLLTEKQVQTVFYPDTEADFDFDSIPEEYFDSVPVLAPKQTLHSRKPQVFRDNIVELLGDRPRVELFSREQVPGWDAWGFEAA